MLCGDKCWCEGTCMRSMNFHGPSSCMGKGDRNSFGSQTVGSVRRLGELRPGNPKHVLARFVGSVSNLRAVLAESIISADQWEIEASRIRYRVTCACWHIYVDRVAGARRYIATAAPDSFATADLACQHHLLKQLRKGFDKWTTTSLERVSSSAAMAMYYTTLRCCSYGSHGRHYADTALHYSRVPSWMPT